MNQVTIMGRLGADPELRYTSSGAAVCNFTVATSERWTDKSGQQQEKTEWHRIAMFGKVAETAGRHLRKGRQVLLQGKLQTRDWEKDGIKRYTTEVVCNHMEFVGDAPKGGQPEAEAATFDQSFANDDIPF